MAFAAVKAAFAKEVDELGALADRELPICRQPLILWSRPLGKARK